MTKAVNGYRNCKLRLVDSEGNQEIIEFSSSRIIITETDAPTSIWHKFNSGDKEKSLKYVEYKWTLDLSEYMEVMDAMQLNRIKNAEFEGKSIFLTPHLDYPWREYEVIIPDEERQLGTLQVGAGNSGYVISFQTKTAYKNFGWVNANILPVVAAETFFEFEN